MKANSDPPSRLKFLLIPIVLVGFVIIIIFSIVSRILPDELEDDWYYENSVDSFDRGPDDLSLRVIVCLVLATFVGLLNVRISAMRSLSGGRVRSFVIAAVLSFVGFSFGVFLANALFLTAAMIVLVVWLSATSYYGCRHVQVGARRVVEPLPRCSCSTAVCWILLISGVLLCLLELVFGFVTRPMVYHSLIKYRRSEGLLQSAPAADLLASPSPSFSGESLGFSTGGAKDVSNFRTNIDKGYLPLPTDVSFEGLFYDYFFDTGTNGPCASLFCPSYSLAVASDPFSGKPEVYMAVGLNSGLTESDFSRKKLNLVIVLDISGSMSSPFDVYYYGGGKEKSHSENSKTKMRIAAESINALLDHLQPDDRFSVVLFDHEAYLAKPMRPVGRTNMRAIKTHFLEVVPRGGTNFGAGYRAAVGMFTETVLEGGMSTHENRIIFITDAMPNTGITDERSLVGMASQAADRHIHTTFIGVGVDFNTELISEIAQVAGANYFAVHSAEDFMTRMDDEFDFMTTPLVFDLGLSFSRRGGGSPLPRISRIYGASKLSFGTLFPSRVRDEETRGGIILVSLDLGSPEEGREVLETNLVAEYIDREEEFHSVSSSIDFGAVVGSSPSTFFENSGVRKGVLLARYAELLRSWMHDERRIRFESPHMDYEPVSSPEHGIGKSTDCCDSAWERSSQPLTLSLHYRGLFEEFLQYMEEEIEAIGDTELDQEVQTIHKILNSNPIQ